MLSRHLCPRTDIPSASDTVFIFRFLFYFLSPGSQRFLPIRIGTDQYCTGNKHDHEPQDDITAVACLRGSDTGTFAAYLFTCLFRRNRYSFLFHLRTTDGTYFPATCPIGLPLCSGSMSCGRYFFLRRITAVRTGIICFPSRFCTGRRFAIPMHQRVVLIICRNYDICRRDRDCRGWFGNHSQKCAVISCHAPSGEMSLRIVWFRRNLCFFSRPICPTACSIFNSQDICRLDRLKPDIRIFLIVYIRCIFTADRFSEFRISPLIPVCIAKTEAASILSSPCELSRI